MRNVPPEAMRLLDRYLLREFLGPLAACLVGFLIFWVAFDLFGELETLRREQATWIGAGRLYWLRMPEMLTVIVPVGTLLALLYSVARHSRHNELTAMRAAGLSFWRICLPYYATGIALSTGLWWANESLGRDARTREDALRASWAHPGATAVDLAWRSNVPFQNQAELRSWHFGAFNLITGEARLPRVAWYDPTEARDEIDAETAQWTNGYWALENGAELFFRGEQDTSPARRPRPALTAGEFGGTPDTVDQWPGFKPIPRPGIVFSNAAISNIAGPGPGGAGQWTAAYWNPSTRQLRGLRGLFPVERGARTVVMAASGRWTNGAWTMADGREYLYRSKADTEPIEAPFAERRFDALTESPEMVRSEVQVAAQLVRSRLAKKPELSVSEVLTYERLHPRLPAVDRARLDTQMQARLAAPWACLIVALLAPPFGAPSGRRNVFYGVAGSIAIAFCYFAVQRSSFALGQGQIIAPWLAAWLPNMAFGFLGATLTARAR